MEVLIILIVVGIIGYLIYQSLPNQRFEKAVSLYNSGNLALAAKLLNEIFGKHPDAPAKLAQCKLKEGQQVKAKNETVAIKLFNEAIEIKKRLPGTASKTKYELIEANACYEIAAIQFNNLNKIKNARERCQGLKDNLQLIEKATKAGAESHFSALEKQHHFELAELNFLFGIENEKSLQLTKAVQDYSTARDYSIQSSNSKILYASITRRGICQLKNKQNFEPQTLEYVYKSTDEYKRDFFYRYTKRLLEEEEYSEAEKMIGIHLNFSSSSIDKIKNFIQSKRVEKATKKVIEINNTIEKLYENSFPIEEVKKLYENVDQQFDEIKSAIPTLTDKLRDLKPSLFNRLLSHYIASEQFTPAIGLIRRFPQFWESPELLKNLGICCFGFTAQGNLSEANYRIIISNWLTSVFSDKVILKSLEATSWDDNYTFSLAEAIGSNYEQHTEVPNNANYDEVTDTNISIGATQKELLQQYELLLHNTISDTSLSKAVNDYYSNEKEAIEKAVKIIIKDILFAAPQFAKTHGLNEEIIRELNKDYIKYRNEESLEAGLPYIKDHTDTYVQEYASAKEIISRILSAIRNENLSELKVISADQKKSLIDKYETIKNSTEDLVFHAIGLKITENRQFENLLPIMEECIRSLKQNQKLRDQCSLFIHNFCDLKWKSKPAPKLLEYMLKSIEYNPNNYRAAKSITILINNNLMDIANGVATSTAEIFTLIDKVKRIQSPVLKDALKELHDLRNKLLAALNPESRATVLMGINLNTNGVKLKKVIDTMEALSGGTSFNSR